MANRSRKSRKTRAAIKASANTIKAINLDAPIKITAAEGDGPPAFDVTAYTGAAMEVAGWDHPLVIDLGGLEFARNIVANLDHEQSRRVGHVTKRSTEGGELKLSGIASAATPHRAEVVDSAKQGFAWEASVEVAPRTVEELAAGSAVEVNGRTVDGPAHIVRSGKLTGFAFVSHGADVNTETSIAAAAANGPVISAELREFAAGMLPGVTIDDLTAEALANLEADRVGKAGTRQATATYTKSLNAWQHEHNRREAIEAAAVELCERSPMHAEQIRASCEQAIEQKRTPDQFRLECLEQMTTLAPPIHGARNGDRINGRTIEAAICNQGRLKDLDKHFSDQELDQANKHFRHGLGLKQLFCLAAEANGYRPQGFEVDLEVQRAAFGMTHGPRIKAANFSNLDIATTLSNIANKFLMEGWMAVDQTALRVSRVKSVNDFKTHTTVSLTGDQMFEQVGPDGALKHGTIGELTYTNKADTYGKILGITRADMINDDLDALTSTPRRIGRGGMLKLNDIFWTAFLDNATFFAAGNNNVITGATSALSHGALALAEEVFLEQTDPDGHPVAVSPSILLVPAPLIATARELHVSQMLMTGSDVVVGSTNVFSGRFAPETSPYMSNASYTGYSDIAWYLLADPSEMPVIEIAALNGRVEPVVETADAPFDTLGVNMRGYSDIGVAMQEYRGGVRAAGA